MPFQLLILFIFRTHQMISKRCSFKSLETRTQFCCFKSLLRLFAVQQSHARRNGRIYFWCSVQWNTQTINSKVEINNFGIQKMKKHPWHKQQCKITNNANWRLMLMYSDTYSKEDNFGPKFPFHLTNKYLIWTLSNVARTAWC